MSEKNNNCNEICLLIINQKLEDFSKQDHDLPEPTPMTEKEFYQMQILLKVKSRITKEENSDCLKIMEEEIGEIKHRNSPFTVMTEKDFFQQGLLFWLYEKVANGNLANGKEFYCDICHKNFVSDKKSLPVGEDIDCPNCNAKGYATYDHAGDYTIEWYEVDK